MFIAIAGNIGVGKSSLTSLLAQRLGWEGFQEVVDENPYLADFYQDMERWSFHSQVYFLSRRMLQHRHLLDYPGHVVQDRSIYEDGEIFAESLYRQGKMTERDHDCYRSLYNGICELLAPPSLMVYLQAPVGTLAERIATRGRKYERQVSIAYLAELNALYDTWAAAWSRCPLVTIPTAELDFVHRPDDLEIILLRLQEYIGDAA